MLDTELELVHFFKKSVDNKPYQTMSLNYGVLSDDLHLDTDIIDEVTGDRQPGFKFQFMSVKGKKKGTQMTVIPEQKEQIQVMVNAFNKGAKNIRNNTSKVLKMSLEQVEQEVKRDPLRKRSGINRLSMALYNAPEILTGSETRTKHKNPKNFMSGIGYGSLAFAKGIVFGITGLVTEPYKGAKAKGAKGAFVGVGKGLVGLVSKPVAGTVGLVGCTVQGAVNTPGTIAKSVKKNKNSGAPQDHEEEEKKAAQ